MCLLINDPTPKIAEKDLEVYKFLTYDSNQRLYTPFQLDPIRFSLINGRDIAIQTCKEIRPERYNAETWMIEKGIHSTLNEDYLSYNRRYKAIIPKGTTYYTDGIHYASTKLIIFNQKIPSSINIII